MAEVATSLALMIWGLSTRAWENATFCWLLLAFRFKKNGLVSAKK